MKKILFVISVLFFIMVSCTTSKKTTAAYHTYQTECISQNADGTILLRAWAIGEFSKQAIAEAEKKAVEDIIFNGINAGANNWSQTPLVISGNAREKYEMYFAKFFADGGDYTKYIQRSKKHSESMVRLKNKGTKNRAILIEVNRTALKARLTQDGIL